MESSKQMFSFNTPSIVFWLFTLNFRWSSIGTNFLFLVHKLVFLNCYFHNYNNMPIDTFSQLKITFLISLSLALSCLNSLVHCIHWWTGASKRLIIIHQRSECYGIIWNRELLVHSIVLHYRPRWSKMTIRQFYFIFFTFRCIHNKVL